MASNRTDFHCLSGVDTKDITEICNRNIEDESQSEQNESAVTAHVNTKNHPINCDEATIVGRESDRTTGWMREPSRSDRNNIHQLSNLLLLW